MKTTEPQEPMVEPSLLSKDDVGIWENLTNVIFDIGTNLITLISEEGYIATIQCDDLLELYRIALISFAICEGSNVDLMWRIP